MAFPTSPADRTIWPTPTVGAKRTKLWMWNASLGAWRRMSSRSEAFAASANLIDWLPYNAAQYNGTKGSGIDIGPYLNEALQWLRNTYGRARLHLPPGLWRLATVPPPALLSGMSIVGEGSQATTIIVDKTSGAIWHWSGAGGYTGGGMEGVGTVLDLGLGATTCETFVLQGDASFQPGQMFFSDCYTTVRNVTDTLDGGGKVQHPATSWYDIIKVYGNAKATGAQGVREVVMSGMQSFGARVQNMLFSNAIGVQLHNSGSYVPGVTNPGTIGASPPVPTYSTTGCDIRISGGGSYGPTNFTNTSSMSTDNLQCNGTVYADNCNAVSTRGSTLNYWTNATAVNSEHAMKVTGTKTMTVGAGSVDRCY